MFIRCWGARGSIPVSGKEYLKYGGDTVCMEIRSKSGAIIIIDAGTGIRPLGAQLIKEGVRSVDMLFTHAHLDHLIGFPFFNPLYAHGTTVTIHGYSYDSLSFESILAGLIRSPYFPITLNHASIQAKLVYKKVDRKQFRIGGITVTPIPLSHPDKGGRGFRFEEDGKRFVFLTDNELNYVHDGGLTFDAYVDFCNGADLLVHDAEYVKKEYANNRSWGHSLFTDAVRLGLVARVKALGLFHFNNHRTDRQVDIMVKRARSVIAAKGSTMKCCAVGCNFRTTL